MCFPIMSLVPCCCFALDVYSYFIIQVTELSTSSFLHLASRSLLEMVFEHDAFVEFCFIGRNFWGNFVYESRKFNSTFRWFHFCVFRCWLGNVITEQRKCFVCLFNNSDMSFGAGEEFPGNVLPLRVSRTFYTWFVVCDILARRCKDLFACQSFQATWHQFMNRQQLNLSFKPKFSRSANRWESRKAQKY